jgi:hypothetical protein
MMEPLPVRSPDGRAAEAVRLTGDIYRQSTHVAFFLLQAFVA